MLVAISDCASYPAHVSESDMASCLFLGIYYFVVTQPFGQSRGVGFGSSAFLGVSHDREEDGDSAM